MAQRLQPGDLFFTSGHGIIGALIRYFSHSPVAHTGVVVATHEDGTIDTHEAFYPSGVVEYLRKDPGAMKIQRVHRITEDPITVGSMLIKSDEFVGLPYDMLEIVRIVLWGLRRFLMNSVVVTVVILASFFSLKVWGSALLVSLWVTLYIISIVGSRVLRRDNPDRVICSNHVAKVALVGDRSIKLSYPPELVWPGRLEQDLHLHNWRLK